MRRRRWVSVAVVGLGLVGLHLAAALLQAGAPVVGIDVDPRRLQMVASGVPVPAGPPAPLLRRAVEEQRLRLAAGYEAVAQAGVVCICVPTPLTTARAPDLSALDDAVRGLAEQAHPGQLVVVESSVPPGTTEASVARAMEARGLRVGRDVFVACSPERLDPGNQAFPLARIPRLVGGVTPECTRRAAAFYRRFVRRVVPVSSPRVAEMAKLVENTFRYVNVALANEAALLCERMGLDPIEVVEAAQTKPFGFMAFYPGPGPGGTCIPVSPFYLRWAARRVGMPLHMVEAARRVNDAMAGHVVRRVTQALARLGPGAREVLILGVSYKPGTAEIRNAPARRVMARLLRRGLGVRYHDPYVPSLTVAGRRLHSVPLDGDALARAQCVVLMTDHPDFDLPLIAAQVGDAFVDARYALRRGRRPRP